MSTHDPYLVTVSRNLNEEKIQNRKKKINTQQKSFLSQSVHISDYIYLPAGLEKILTTILFILIPYLLGLLVLLVLMDFASFKDFIVLTFDIYMLTWTVGYESIAVLLLLAILKSAITFKPK